LSTDSIHAVIATLLDKGLIKRDSCADPDEMRRHVHVLTDRGLAETARLARRSIARQMDEYAEFRAVIKAMRVDFAAAEDGESEA
jgi:DNA-binding MarR family transcriptional regulator